MLAKAFLIGCGKKSPTRRQEASSNEADSFDGVHDVRMLSFYGCAWTVSPSVMSAVSWGPAVELWRRKRCFPRKPWAHS